MLALREHKSALATTCISRNRRLKGATPLCLIIRLSFTECLFGCYFAPLVSWPVCRKPQRLPKSPAFPLVHKLCVEGDIHDRITIRVHGELSELLIFTANPTWGPVKTRSEHWPSATSKPPDTE